jgi:hypothetical protein
MAFRTRHVAKAAELDRAVEAWRAGRSADEGLSEAARARILREARTASTVERRVLRPLFLPLPRLALGGALPVLALSLALVALVALQGDLRTVGPAGRGHTRVEATKSGDNVVFVIRNGSRAHTVFRSAEPGAFGSEPIATTASGRFHDRLAGDDSIVYYRID